MDFEHYIKLTRETAVYPEDYERDYVIHGLVDEAGELKETIETPPTDDFSGFKRSEFGGLHIKKICDELGDVTWYTARAVDHFDFDPENFFGVDRKRLGEMDKEDAKEKADEVLSIAAEMNGHQKKSVRDDSDRTGKFKNNLYRITSKIEKITHHCGLFDIEVVMERNIEKLFDRKAREVLHGDGDNR